MNDDLNNSAEIFSSKRRYMLYSLPRFGTSIVLGIESWALFTLYTVAYSVNSFLVGFALSMGYLSIAASQFLLGWVSDAKYTKLGRRKPWIIAFSPLLGISFIFVLMPALILPDTTNKTIMFYWLLVWEVLFRISYGLTTPYQSWAAEQFNVNERPLVSQFQNTFNFIGNGVMALFTLLVLTGVFEKIQNNPQIIPPEFFAPVLGFAIFTIALFYLIVIIMPKEPNYKIESNLKENLQTILKNKNYVLTTLMRGITGIALSIITAVMLTYTVSVLNLGGIDYILIAAMLLISIFIFLYIWRKLIQRRGKKQTLLYIFLLGIFFLPVSLLGLIPTISPLFLGLLFITGIAAILGGWYLFPYIIDADMAEDDQKSTGELKAGIYTGFPSILLNLFQALGIFLLGAITSLPEVSVRGQSFSIGLVLWGPLCSLILLISYIYTKKFLTLDFKWEIKYE
ncbi:MAG: MFS transporter [Candidatus Lokiarchaeota archaeon]|nr:MFS transporter [Candidatus Lokiarchaeota archaeon]MBD3342181.1 MFS transporter [Candidatus Lokiarchaeota archaeon]